MRLLKLLSNPLPLFLQGPPTKATIIATVATMTNGLEVEERPQSYRKTLCRIDIIHDAGGGASILDRSTAAPTLRS